MAQVVNTGRLQHWIPRNMACFRYVIVNTLHRGGDDDDYDDDDDDDDDDNNYDILWSSNEANESAFLRKVGQNSIPDP